MLVGRPARRAVPAGDRRGARPGPLGASLYFSGHPPASLLNSKPCAICARRCKASCRLNSGPGRSRTRSSSTTSTAGVATSSRINEAGNIEVTPAGPGSPHDRPQGARRRPPQPRPQPPAPDPLLRHPEDPRRAALRRRSSRRSSRTTTRAAYRGVYPIKVNQQRHVVEELIEYGRPFNLGIEAGSKPELLVALALQDNPEALILCNGYKDRAYIETALLAQKLGRQVIIIMDRMGELETDPRRAARARHPAGDRRARPALHQGRRQVGRVDGRPLEVRPHHRRDRGHRRAPARPRACSTACSSCTSTSARRSRTSAPSRTRCASRAASSSSCTRSAPTCASSTAAAVSASTTTAARPTSTPR